MGADSSPQPFTAVIFMQKRGPYRHGCELPSVRCRLDADLGSDFRGSRKRHSLTSASSSDCICECRRAREPRLRYPRI